MNVKNNNKGFSLVELMVVVAIIGILAAVAIPQFSKFQARSRQSEAKAHLSGIYTAQKGFQAEWASFYGGLKTIGYGPDGGGIAGSALRYTAGFTGLGTIPANVTAAAGDGSHLGAAGSTICANAGTPTICLFHSNFTAGGTAPTAAQGPAPTATTFQAAAVGNPNSRALAGVDVWTINQNKVLAYLTQGID